MSKRLKSKHKIDRRMGENIWGRPKSPINARQYGPGQHGLENKRKKQTNYGIQLRAKQKLKGYYGNIGEKQFRNIYEMAANKKGDTSELIIGLLERRLDAVVYRLKFATTVFAARQLVNHGHVLVNGKKLDIPSAKLCEGDEVEIREDMKQNVKVMESTQLPERDVPEYVEADHSKMKGKLLRIPAIDEVPYPVKMEPNLVIEFYSR